METERVFGAIPSPRDDRDYTIATVGLATETEFPDEFLIDSSPAILDQGSTGSCVAHALASAMESKTGLDMSRGYIYCNRSDDDYQEEGMYPRQALNHLVKEGDVLYKDFPYNPPYYTGKDILAKQREVNPELDNLAAEHKITAYFNLKKETDIKEALMNQCPVIAMIAVYSDTKNLAVHNSWRNCSYCGFHEVLCVGWNTDGWIFQNSWGEDWGENGRFYCDYNYPAIEWWGITMPVPEPEPEPEPDNTTDDETKEDEEEQQQQQETPDGFFAKLLQWLLNLINKIFKKDK